MPTNTDRPKAGRGRDPAGLPEAVAVPGRAPDGPDANDPGFGPDDRRSEAGRPAPGTGRPPAKAGCTRV